MVDSLSTTEEGRTMQVLHPTSSAQERIFTLTMPELFCTALKVLCWQRPLLPTRSFHVPLS